MAVGVITRVAFAFGFRIAAFKNSSVRTDDEMIRNIAPISRFAHAPFLNICDMFRSVLILFEPDAAVMDREAFRFLFGVRACFQSVPIGPWHNFKRFRQESRWEKKEGKREKAEKHDLKNDKLNVSASFSRSDFLSRSPVRRGVREFRLPSSALVPSYRGRER